MTGQMLKSRYLIVKLLGRGGFGETYLANDRERHNQFCVVKLLKPQSTDGEFRAIAGRLFDREITMLAKLGSHPQIPYIIDRFVEAENVYLVQEFIPGHTLSAEIKPGKCWTGAEVIKFLEDILPTLKFIHQANVIHRDIKPSNIIRRSQDGKLVVIDFGAVKEISGVSAVNNMTTVTIAIGTPGYMPNEQLGGKPRFCSDIYAVGMIAIQALTGCLPDQFPEDPKTAEILWHSYAPNCPPGLKEILDKMIKYDFRQRFATAQEVMDAIKLNNQSAYLIDRFIKQKPILTISLLTILLGGVTTILFGDQLKLKTILSFLNPIEKQSRVVPLESELTTQKVEKIKQSISQVNSQATDRLEQNNNLQNNKQAPLPEPKPIGNTQSTDRGVETKVNTENNDLPEPLQSNQQRSSLSSSQTKDDGIDQNIEESVSSNDLNQTGLEDSESWQNVQTRTSKVKPEVETLLLEAVKLARQKQYQPALTIVDTVLENNPNLAVAWLIKSRIHRELRQYDQALYARNKNWELNRNNAKRSRW